MGDARARRCLVGLSSSYWLRMMSAACPTMVAEYLIPDHDRWQHQRVGVPGARIAEPVDHQRGGRMGQWPVAQQRL